MRGLFFSLLLAGFMGVPLAAQAGNGTLWDTHPEWFSCQEDDQCVLRCENCGNVAVNTKSAQHAAEVRPSCRESIPCFSEAVAQCLNNQCVSVIQGTRK